MDTLSKGAGYFLFKIERVKIIEEREGTRNIQHESKVGYAIFRS